MPKFEHLPFSVRPDLTPYLLHLTKNTNSEDEYSAFDNLVSILQTGKIWGSGKKKGFIKGPNKATCFMDVPFSSLKYVLTPENCNPQSPRYEPYGLVLNKKSAYKRGCRPVLYLADDEMNMLGIPDEEKWRVVRFECRNNDDWISFVHEREWRHKGSFKLPRTVDAVLVKDTVQAVELRKRIERSDEEFKCVPHSIIPLEVLCQGLPL